MMITTHPDEQTLREAAAQPGADHLHLVIDTDGQYKLTPDPPARHAAHGQAQRAAGVAATALREAGRMTRAYITAARDLARRLNAAVTDGTTFRAAPARDESGPGYIIERRPAGGSWSFAGWSEDVRQVGNAFLCYGRRLA